MDVARDGLAEFVRDAFLEDAFSLLMAFEVAGLDIECEVALVVEMPFEGVLSSTDFATG